MIYVGSVYKISRKKNKESTRFKNFRQFRRFALHYESVESAEGRFSYLSEKNFLNKGHHHGQRLKWEVNIWFEREIKISAGLGIPRYIKQPQVFLLSLNELLSITSALFNH